MKKNEYDHDKKLQGFHTQKVEMSRKNGDAINNDSYLFSLQYTFRVVRDCGLPFKKVKHLETDAFLEHSFCSEIEKYFLDKVFHNFF